MESLGKLVEVCLLNKCDLVDSAQRDQVLCRSPVEIVGLLRALGVGRVRGSVDCRAHSSKP